MASLFTVTTTTNTLHLSEKRQGEVVFTVSNASGHRVRGRTMLQPEDAEAADWLHLEGEAERDFPKDHTEQYTVKIAVPAHAPAGSYSFRLDMVGVERPDEDYTRGQTVTIEMLEAEPEPKPFPAWIVLIAVGVLLLGGIIWYVFSPSPVDQVRVPNVEGDEIIQAITKLNDVGLRWHETTEQNFHQSIPAGHVIGTDPPKDSMVEHGEALQLILSRGPVVFNPPDWPIIDLYEAPQFLQQDGITVRLDTTLIRQQLQRQNTP